MQKIIPSFTFWIDLVSWLYLQSMEELIVFEPAAKRQCQIINHNKKLDKTRLQDVIHDCLSIILDYLDTKSIVNLVEVGDKMFCARLFFSILRLRIQISSKEKSTWPSLISRCCNLVYLTIEHASFDQSNVKIWPLNFGSVSSTLVFLKINGFVLQVDSPACLPSSVFSNLRTINFLGSRFVLPDATKITSNVMRHVNANFQNLSTLALPDVSTIDQAFLDETSTLLQTLSVGKISGEANLARLTLESLYCILNTKKRPIIFPTTLTNLTVLAESPKVAKLYAPTFPPLLTRLTIHANLRCLKKCFFQEQAILVHVATFTVCLLPKAPHQVVLSRFSSELLARICCIIPNVSSLYFSKSTRLCRDIDLSILPKSLTRLSSVFMTNYTQWKHVPKTCRILQSVMKYPEHATINEMSLNLVDDLPNIVESITLETSPQLTGLEIFAKRSWDELFYLEAKLINNVDFFESIPASLTTLNIRSNNSINLYNSAFDRLVNLKTLIFGVSAPVPVFSESVDHFQHFDTWLSHLPSAITFLSITVRGSWSCHNNNEFGNCKWPTSVNHLELWMLQCNFPLEAIKDSLSTIANLSKLVANFDRERVRFGLQKTGATRSVITHSVFESKGLHILNSSRNADGSYQIIPPEE